MRKEIEKRLTDLSVSIIRLSQNFEDSYISEHLTNQITRSSTSAALNYGETQGAESHNDFIHKASLVLKELRETGIALSIISKSGIHQMSEELDKIIDECNQHTAIMHKTVITAKKKRGRD